jgi:hypothetical protein
MAGSVEQAALAEARSIIHVEHRGRNHFITLRQFEMRLPCFGMRRPLGGSALLDRAAHEIVGVGFGHWRPSVQRTIYMKKHIFSLMWIRRGADG